MAAQASRLSICDRQQLRTETQTFGSETLLYSDWQEVSNASFPLAPYSRGVQLHPSKAGVLQVSDVS